MLRPSLSLLDTPFDLARQGRMPNLRKLVEPASRMVYPAVLNQPVPSEATLSHF